MDHRANKPNDGEGRLPAIAPLANPYVPFQMHDPEKYTCRKGFIRGTLFPGLDLPFMDLVNTKEKEITPLTELQVMAFAIQELALYLDTHTDDAEALDLYRSYQKLYAEAKDVYQKCCGPLNHCSVTEGGYTWLDGPWPWEYKKQEV